ncbi:hypothetical protein AVEN_76494-1 [Araneus ventricosus]|uniref:Uncharacterized protein n=1 Tax=Araneus ventricosus TaxID=182803 RepID=A0A4Y2CDM5_ARAVE|nr:hypothetical protein AVEN_76494-1 [Araneus ventricosus]
MALFCHIELAANALQARVALVVTANLPQVRFKFDASNFAMTREYQVKIKLAANLRAIWVFTNPGPVGVFVNKYSNVSTPWQPLKVAPGTSISPITPVAAPLPR